MSTYDAMRARAALLESVARSKLLLSNAVFQSDPETLKSMYAYALQLRHRVYGTCDHVVPALLSRNVYCFEANLLDAIGRLRKESKNGKTQTDKG